MTITPNHPPGKQLGRVGNPRHHIFNIFFTDSNIRLDQNIAAEPLVIIIVRKIRKTRLQHLNLFRLSIV